MSPAATRTTSYPGYQNGTVARSAAATKISAKWNFAGNKGRSQVQLGNEGKMTVYFIVEVFLLPPVACGDPDNKLSGPPEAGTVARRVTVPRRRMKSGSGRSLTLQMEGIVARSATAT